MVNAKINVFKALTLCIGVVMLLFHLSFSVKAQVDGTGTGENAEDGNYFYALKYEFNYRERGEYVLEIEGSSPFVFFYGECGLGSCSRTDHLVAMACEDAESVNHGAFTGTGGMSSNSNSSFSKYQKMHFDYQDPEHERFIDALTDNVLIFSDEECARAYIDEGSDRGLLYGDINSEVVEWYEFEYNAAYYIKNFVATQSTEELSGSWTGVFFTSRRGDNLIDNSLIRLKYYYTVPGEGRFSGGSRYYPDVFQGDDREFLINLSDIQLPEGAYISCIAATPYVYVGDSQLRYYRGRTTTIYFDEEGIIEYRDEIAADMEYDEQEAEWSIWNSITNFFSDFWNNLLDALYDLFIPETDVLLEHFNNFNDLFSERLGFIWYPFDLAIQLVNALAGGEADSTFIVPGYSLDVQGVSYVIWEPIEVDMDAVGIFEYVRFFTSTLLVCGTVRLAIKKWDEWIGGRTNGN